VPGSGDKKMLQPYVRIVFILLMIAALCSIAGAVSIGAEPHVTSGAFAPACTAPCECMSLTDAMQRWGANGYDYCSKTVCGQSADAMTQYYCLHQVGSSAAATTTVPAQVPVQSTAVPPAAPPAAGVTQKSPVGIAAIIAAMGAALLAAAAMRRK
jgi:hypothetical protein